jgi:hypothetical protein
MADQSAIVGTRKIGRTFRGVYMPAEGRAFAGNKFYPPHVYWHKSKTYSVYQKNPQHNTIEKTRVI